jgi:hypothetical protein
VQCSAVQSSAVQCSAVQCSAVQCSAVQCSAVQCSGSWAAWPETGWLIWTQLIHSDRAVQCSAVQCSAVQCSGPLASQKWTQSLTLSDFCVINVAYMPLMLLLLLKPQLFQKLKCVKTVKPNYSIDGDVVAQTWQKPSCLLHTFVEHTISCCQLRH